MFSHQKIYSAPPPVVIESGESSMSCDPEPSAPSPTSLSSSILNETEDSVLEESEVGDGVLGSGFTRQG